MDHLEGLQIRSELPRDQDAVAALLRAAFGDDIPAGLAQRLRTEGLVVPSLTAVACLGKQLVGCLMMSRLSVCGEKGEFEALNLTPFAVEPSMQGQGVGRRLMTWVLEEAARTEYPLVALEGDPRHYQRYGFVRSTEQHILRPSERIPEAAFQVKRLPAHRAEVHRGTAVYPPLFYELGAVGP